MKQLVKNTGRFVKGNHYNPDTEFKKGIRASLKTEFKKGQPKSKKWYDSMKNRIPWNRGKSGYKTKPLSEERKLKISLAQKGKPRWTEEQKNRYFRGKNHPQFGKKQSIEVRHKHSIAQRGERGSNWKGGITPIKYKIRNSFEMRNWRKAVFERDGYACQVCRKVGVSLVAHHIKSFAHHSDLRFDINNGVTLCDDCHKLTDNYCGRERRKYG